MPLEVAWARSGGPWQDLAWSTSLSVPHLLPCMDILDTPGDCEWC